ncbi:hypothetical protein [Yeosuana marina]|uniref:hypothetical protein n=1 Tax=Yeosuana marina TaxID=1565536 RepID=UPI001420960A|nr:hypothetical protein [Yeosuana marina]
MKTLLLFMTSLLLSITATSATEQHPEPKDNHVNPTKYYRYAQPIVFVERGVEFSIFPDGSFDFDVLHNTYYNNSNTRRTTINAGYATRGVQVRYTSVRSNAPVIVKDRFGKITRVGNSPIYYDRMGDVTQIGSVDIDYSRGNKIVAKVGGLRVNYNHWGQIVTTKGYVNSLNRTFNNYYALNNDTFYDNDYDDTYFYYNKNGKVKKVKKNKR